MKIEWFYTEIWRYIDCQNGGRLRHLGIVLPPYETTHEFSVAGHSCSQISCQSDTQIWRYCYLHFSHIWLEEIW